MQPCRIQQATKTTVDGVMCDKCDVNRMGCELLKMQPSWRCNRHEVGTYGSIRHPTRRLGRRWQPLLAAQFEAEIDRLLIGALPVRLQQSLDFTVTLAAHLSVPPPTRLGHRCSSTPHTHTTGTLCPESDPDPISHSLTTSQLPLACNGHRTC